MDTVVLDGVGVLCASTASSASRLVLLPHRHLHSRLRRPHMLIACRSGPSNVSSVITATVRITLTGPRPGWNCSPPWPGQMHWHLLLWAHGHMAGNCDGEAADSSFFQLLSAVALD